VTTAQHRVRTLPSLHERTLLLTLVPLSLVAVFIATLTVAVSKRSLDDYAGVRNQMVLDNLLTLVEPALASGDQALATNLVVATARSNALANLWITDAAGTVVVASDPAAVGRPLAPRPAAQTCSRPRTQAGGGGQIVLQGDDRIVREVATVVGAGAVLSLGLGVLITAWLVSRLSRSLATPVVNAANAAAAMAEGDFAPAQQLPRSTVREGEMLREALRHTARRLEDLTADLEGQVATRTAQFEMAKEQAQAARDLAEEASKAKTVFLASMSHELRTPLNAIIGYAEMVIEELEGSHGSSRTDVAKIVQAARHLLALINDILDYTKIEAGRMQVHRDQYAVRQVVDEAVAATAPLVAQNHSRLAVSVSDAIGSGTGDALKLRQILINLLGNAAKFTERGRLQLSVSAEGIGDERTLVIAVTDTGIGMDADQRARLFKPFASGETQRRFGGTGLGLAICAHYCQLMGGTIRCESEPGRGSVFTVRVPLHLASESSTARGAVITTRQFSRLQKRSAS
jgi:signal transduction histidine kinase